MNGIARFLRDEEGAAALEYGLLAALIAAIIVAVMTTLGTRVRPASPPFAMRSPAAPATAADACGSGAPGPRCGFKKMDGRWNNRAARPCLSHPSLHRPARFVLERTRHRVVRVAGR